MKVFISHSHRDQAFVRRLAQDLDGNGLEVWYSEWEMKPGDSIAKKIGTGVLSCGYMIVVLSPHSVNSKWVEKELSVGITAHLAEKNVTLIPILLRDCQFPATFHLLGDTIYADFRGDYDGALKRLIAALGVRPCRRGIKRFDGVLEDLKVEKPNAITMAQWEGLSTLWDFDRLIDVVTFYISRGEETSSPLLEVPLTRTEARRIRGSRKSSEGWGYYDLLPPVGAYAACVNITFLSREWEPTHLTWMIDRKRRRALRLGWDIFGGMEDPTFGPPYE